MTVEKIKIEMTGLTDSSVSAICRIVERAGFAYAEHYELLFTGAWVPAGFVTSDAACAAAIMGAIK